MQADAQRLKQVLLNLGSNAIKYNRQGGSVRISLERPTPERALILVTDTGHGISEENQAKLFTPFDRLGADQTQIEGTGLGLALSKLLTEAMGGTLAVESERLGREHLHHRVGRGRCADRRAGRRHAAPQEQRTAPHDRPRPCSTSRTTGRT